MRPHVVRGGVHLVNFRGAGAEDVDDFDTAPGQFVGDQVAMATPRNSLSAHHRRSARERQKMIDGLLKFRRRHVIGVGPERVVPPERVRRIGRRLSPATECLGMPVLDLVFRKTVTDRRGRKVGEPARARIAAHIHQRGDLEGPEDFDQLLERAGRMAESVDLSGQDGENSGRERAISNPFRMLR